MRDSLLVVLAAGTMQAAVIRGVVVEHSTGKPLARTQIVVAPLPGTPGNPQAARSNTYGNFEFGGLPAGGYLISASRRGFPPVQYGQKNWHAAGTPVLLAEDQSTFLNVRMPRYGAITGMVVDENDVGIPDHEIVAYKYAKPPRLVARTTADERGIFRISGLDPGRYLVRTVARLYEDGGYLPTFFRDTMRVDDALFMDVDLDRDIGEARVRAFPGRLHNVSGVATCILPPGTPPPVLQITLTLVSDIGRETVTTGCPPGGAFFKFTNRPPGPYELYAATQDGQGAFIAFTLEDHDWENTFPLLPMASISVNYRGQQGKFINPSSVTVQMRRVDLAGESPIEKQKVTNGRTQLIQGRWQFQLVPNPTYVATDFRGCRNERSEGGRADDWNEFLVNQRVCSVVYTLSDKPSTVRGIVSTNAHEPAAGAPVFLEPWEAMNRKRLGEPRVVRSDRYGKYELIGLAPGTYRLVSTFEYLNPEAVDIDNMLPRTITVEEGRDQQQDIDLFVIR